MSFFCIMHACMVFTASRMTTLLNTTKVDYTYLQKIMHAVTSNYSSIHVTRLCSKCIATLLKQKCYGSTLCVMHNYNDFITPIYHNTSSIPRNAVQQSFSMSCFRSSSKVITTVWELVLFSCLYFLQSLIQPSRPLPASSLPRRFCCFCSEIATRPAISFICSSSREH